MALIEATTAQNMNKTNIQIVFCVWFPSLIFKNWFIFKFSTLNGSGQNP